MGPSPSDLKMSNEMGNKATNIDAKKTVTTVRKITPEEGRKFYNEFEKEMQKNAHERIKEEEKRKGMGGSINDFIGKEMSSGQGVYHSPEKTPETTKPKTQKKEERSGQNGVSKQEMDQFTQEIGEIKKHPLKKETLGSSEVRTPEEMRDSLLDQFQPSKYEKLRSTDKKAEHFLNKKEQSRPYSDPGRTVSVVKPKEAIRGVEQGLQAEAKMDVIKAEKNDSLLKSVPDTQNINKSEDSVRELDPSEGIVVTPDQTVAGGKIVEKIPGIKKPRIIGGQNHSRTESNFEPGLKLSSAKPEKRVLTSKSAKAQGIVSPEGMKTEDPFKQEVTIEDKSAPISDLDKNAKIHNSLETQAIRDKWKKEDQEKKQGIVSPKETKRDINRVLNSLESLKSLTPRQVLEELKNNQWLSKEEEQQSQSESLKVAAEEFRKISKEYTKKLEEAAKELDEKAKTEAENEKKREKIADLEVLTKKFPNDPDIKNLLNKLRSESIEKQPQEESEVNIENKELFDQIDKSIGLVEKIGQKASGAWSMIKNTLGMLHLRKEDADLVVDKLKEGHSLSQSIDMLKKDFAGEEFKGITKQFTENIDIIAGNIKNFEGAGKNFISQNIDYLDNNVLKYLNEASNKKEFSGLSQEIFNFKSNISKIKSDLEAYKKTHEEYEKMSSKFGIIFGTIKAFFKGNIKGVKEYLAKRPQEIKDLKEKLVSLRETTSKEIEQIGNKIDADIKDLDDKIASQKDAEKNNVEEVTTKENSSSPEVLSSIGNKMGELYLQILQKHGEYSTSDLEVIKNLQKLIKDNPNIKDFKVKDENDHEITVEVSKITDRLKMISDNLKSRLGQTDTEISTPPVESTNSKKPEEVDKTAGKPAKRFFSRRSTATQSPNQQTPPLASNKETSIPKVEPVRLDAKQRGDLNNFILENTPDTDAVRNNTKLEKLMVETKRAKPGSPEQDMAILQFINNPNVYDNDDPYQFLIFDDNEPNKKKALENKVNEIVGKYTSEKDALSQNINSIIRNIRSKYEFETSPRAKAIPPVEGKVPASA